MKKLYLAICFMLFAVMGFGQAPSWLWAKSVDGTGSEATSIAIDGNGNAYITGSYINSITFDTITLTTKGSNDIFIAKYTPSGNVLWVKSAGGTGNDVVYSVAVDNSGNVYVAGTFLSSTISFGDSVLSNASPLSLNDDIFLAKYNTNGDLLWAKSIGGTGCDVASCVAVDDFGNAYITGWFSSTTLNFGSTTLTNRGLFIAKYDANGNVQWAKNAEGTTIDWAYSVAVDASGNVCLAGGFHSTSISFGPFTLYNSSVGSNDIFLTKYDANGNVIWAKSAGGTGNAGESNEPRVATDFSGNIYVTGWFQSDTITFGTITLSNAGSKDIFLTKYNTNGDVLWAKSAGGTNEDRATYVAVDVSENIYITGRFDGPAITFDSIIMSNVEVNNIFLAKYNTNGNVLWVKSEGGNNNNWAYSIALDTIENAYLAGRYSDTLILDSCTLTNVGPYDIFIAKLSNDSLMGINEMSYIINISIYPNPTTNNLTIETLDKATIEIYNIEGQIIKTINTAEKQTSIDVSDLAGGVYIIKAKTEKGVAVRKFVKE